STAWCNVSQMSGVIFLQEYTEKTEFFPPFPFISCSNNPVVCGTPQSCPQPCFNWAFLLRNLPALCPIRLTPHNTGLGVDEPLQYLGPSEVPGCSPLPPWRNPSCTTGMRVPDNGTPTPVACLCCRRAKNQ